jgi:hypothetical protein
MRESRATANNAPVDWKAVNDRRRSSTEYRDKERKRSNERDRERRQRDPSYVYKRSESNRVWKESGDAEYKRLRANMLRRQRYATMRSQLTPEELADRKSRQKEGWKQYQAFNDHIFGK